MRKPNIITFITHDQGQHIGCYDSPQTPNGVKTPNLDSLAAEGVKFTNHFCTAPQCSPSRGSIKTSLYPHQNGLMGLVNLGWTLPKHNKTLPMYMKEQGYSTHLLGLQHESLDAKTLGYDTISKRGPEFKYSRSRMEKKYLKFLDEHKDDEKPFYVNIGVIEVHRPFSAWSESVDPEQVKIPPYLPDEEGVREDLAAFYGNIEVTDKTIGRILEHMEEISIMENSIFIYTTDHGIPFPRAKCTLYDPGLKTALIMKSPSYDFLNGGKTIDSLLSNIDLLPSIIDIVGGEIPSNIAGKSFLPVLKGETESIHDEIFAEKTYHEIYDPIRGIRTEKYKYIKNFEDLDTLCQIPKDIMMDSSGKIMKKKLNQSRPEEELYDLKKDPHENTNLIEDDDYSNILYDLRTRLNNWMVNTNDPLLRGRVAEKRQKVKNHY
ncbi:MAG: sulfatase-like hydrolase/transferase [Candidatus Lokiarchaeota archaeon]|nr:sulfatase-like hydrolase/transferase [Candidatus Lokiarchaeota archaeon]MBD3199969.1 sulfatase-like hydrolase/transferase [Candidatus Lokiarchaeota archaeon]